MGQREMKPGTCVASRADISERRVVRRVVAGETDLYGVLADRYNRRLYRFVRRIVRNHMDAEDIVQQTHLRALRYLHQFAGRCKFVTWLSRVAANEAFRYLRQQNRLEELPGTSHAGSRAVPILASPVRDPESLVRDREIRHALRSALAELPQQYRTVFLLREVGDVATEEIASSLMITCANVRLKLFRARRLLRRSINQYQE